MGTARTLADTLGFNALRRSVACHCCASESPSYLFSALKFTSSSIIIVAVS